MRKRSKIILGMAFIAVFVLFRLFVCVKYTILTGSMLPTINVGESVHVFKLLYGWRLYNYKSSHQDSFYRIYGIRGIEPGDVIVFNVPFVGNNYERIVFNQDVAYCKRVLGCPGDRIGTVDGHCWNDRVLRPIGVVGEQEKLRWMFDGFFRMTDSFDVIPFLESGWNIKNWGPLIVPAAGMTMTLDDFTRELYRQVIEYETGKALEDTVTEYTFRGNYYFAVGDNAMSSFDSRYWGFIPEDFIIGIVCGKRFRNK